MNQLFLRGIIVFLLAICQYQSYASDYYWIGGKGSWNDISHWSSTTGGLPSYTVIPGPNDNVFFDANSFTASDTVFLPINAYCKDFDFQSSYSVVFARPGQWPTLNVNGDFKLRPNFDLGVNTFIFSSGYNNQFEIEGASILYMTLLGNGQWEFPSYATISNLNISQGKLLISADSFSIDWLRSDATYGSYKARIDIESDYCRLANFQLDNDTLITTNSVIYDLRNIYTPGATYTRMGDVHTHSLYTRVNVQATNSSIHQLFIENQDVYLLAAGGHIDTLTISAGRSVEFGPGQNMSISRIEAFGTCNKPVKFIGAAITKSTVPGVQSTNINYATFRYMNFSNGIQASNSVDILENSGITFNGSSGSQTYYWVGGRGDYYDSSHWSLSSGGSPIACVPNEGDTIVFDANSFTQADTVFYPTEIHVGGVQISTDKVYFKSLLRPQNIFYLFGNMSLSILTPGLDSASVSFYLNQDAFLSCSGSKLDHMILTSVGKKLSLLDDTLRINKITVVNGIINFDDRFIQCKDFYIGTLQGTQASMINTIIQTESFRVSVGTGSFSANGSFVRATTIFHAIGSNVFLPLVEVVQESQQRPDIYFNDASCGRLRITGYVQFRHVNGEADTIELNPNSELSCIGFISGFKVNNQFKAMGTCNERILIQRGAFQFVSSTQLLFDNVDFYDVSLSGKSGIVAANCTKMHFCSGFNVTASSVKKYWIGGKGSWHDPSHWSSQSGGSAVNCIPNFNDTVIIDQNSFSSDYDTIFLDTGVYAACAFIDASALNRQLILHTNSQYSIKFVYTQYGAYLSPKLRGRFGAGLVQNGASGSWFNLNGFIGPSLSILVQGNGNHEIYGHSDSINGLYCENGITTLHETDFKTKFLRVGTTTVRSVSSNYPYTRLVLKPEFTVHTEQFTIEGIGNLMADSANVHAAYIFWDRRSPVSPIKLSRFVFDTELDPLKKQYLGTVSGSIDARAIVLRRNLNINSNSLFKSDSFLVNGAQLVNMYSGSEINVKDFFFAQGNNCNQITLKGSGTTTNVRSNTASFHCDHLIIQDVGGVGSSSFLAGTYSQLSGNTGNWIQGSNPNLVTRIGAKKVLTCQDSTLVDLFPFYGSADSVQISGVKHELLSWVKDTGEFIIEAFYDNSCSIFDTLRIQKVSVKQSFLPSDTLFCGKDSIYIVPLVQYASPWNKIWNDNSTQDSLLVKNSGVYWMEVNQPGCSFRDSMKVYMGKTFSPEAITRDTVSCDGDSVYVSITQAINYSVDWNDQVEGHGRYLKDQGIYTYIIADSSCETSDSIRLSQISLRLDILGDSIFCEGDSIELVPSQNSGIYSWQDGSSNRSFWATTSGPFVLTLMDSGCMAIDTHQVSMQPKLLVQILGDSLFCEGDSVSLSVQTNASSWQWTDGNTQNPRWVNAIGMYQVQTIDAICSSADSLQVEAISLPSFNWHDTSLCENDLLKIPINGLPNDVALLLNGEPQLDTIEIRNEGDYILRIEKEKCFFVDSAFISYFPTISYTVSDSFDFCEMENQSIILPLDTPYSYYWNGQLLLSEVIPIDSAGGYNLEIYDQYGCSQKEQVHIFSCACRLYFPSAITINEDKKNEQFYGVGCSNVSSYRLLIYNRWGELLFESSNPEEAWDGTFRGQVCAEGVYVYLVSYNNQAQAGTPSRFHEKGTLTILR